MTARYGVVYKAGGYTGGITEHYRLAAHYAREYAGVVYEVGTPGDPERRTTKEGVTK